MDNSFASLVLVASIGMVASLGHGLAPHHSELAASGIEKRLAEARAKTAAAARYREALRADRSWKSWAPLTDF